MMRRVCSDNYVRKRRYAFRPLGNEVGRSCLFFLGFALTAQVPDTPIAIRTLDPKLASIVAASAQIEKIAGGFAFTEGPVWVPKGYLLFSDIPNNKIYKWISDTVSVSVFLDHSGYGGTDAAVGAYVGSNGLTLDRQGRLTICETGNRRVTRLEPDGVRTVLADRYLGKRLNSPNDLVYKSDGSLYFTDPPHGLPKEDQDPKKELAFNGIYRLNGKELQLLSNELTRPNGIAFSPDEKILYASNSDSHRKVWVRFDVRQDGTLGRGSVFYDATAERAEGLPDGMKVDERGNLYCTGPGGVWIFAPDGKHLGTIVAPETPANLGWGGDDGKTLFITARTSVYRIQMQVRGVIP
jgi:gluconolactonase